MDDFCLIKSYFLLSFQECSAILQFDVSSTSCVAFMFRDSPVKVSVIPWIYDTTMVIFMFPIEQSSIPGCSKGLSLGILVCIHFLIM